MGFAANLSCRAILIILRLAQVQFSSAIFFVINRLDAINCINRVVAPWSTLVLLNHARAKPPPDAAARGLIGYVTLFQRARGYRLGIRGHCRRIAGSKQKERPQHSIENEGCDGPDQQEREARVQDRI
jgi:hypothetical protein